MEALRRDPEVRVAALSRARSWHAPIGYALLTLALAYGQTGGTLAALAFLLLALWRS